MTQASIWMQTAIRLGWRYSAAHDGFISENHRNGPEWADYVVRRTAEDACFLDGVETVADALLSEREGK